MAGMDADPSMSQSPMGEPDGDIERALSSPVVNGIQTRDSRHFAFDDYLHTNVLDNVDADNVALISTHRHRGGDRTARQKTAAAEVRFLNIKPYTAVEFNGLRENLASRALAQQPRRRVEDAVTKVQSLRGGQRPVDTFSVMCDDVLNNVLGARGFVQQPNGTGVKMVPPLALRTGKRTKSPASSMASLAASLFCLSNGTSMNVASTLLEAFWKRCRLLPRPDAAR